MIYDSAKGIDCCLRGGWARAVTQWGVIAILLCRGGLLLKNDKFWPPNKCLDELWVPDPTAVRSGFALSRHLPPKVPVQPSVPLLPLLPLILCVGCSPGSPHSPPSCSGWIAALSELHGNLAVAIIMMVVAGFFTLCAVLSLFLLKQVSAARGEGEVWAESQIHQSAAPRVSWGCHLLSSVWQFSLLLKA